MMDYFESKKVLLTNIHLNQYAGSEINTLTIANYFKKVGAEVEVATLSYDYPIKKDFEFDNINVIDIFKDNLKYSHYDIIWAQHSIILDYLIFEKEISADSIIFNSLSPFEPYEVTPSYSNEISLVTANSYETMNRALLEGVKREKIVLFPNYVTDDYFEKARQNIGDKVSKIAVISNHIPEEELSAVEQLRDLGISVDIYGIGYNTVLINEEILCEYDAVISIGKTVQYCFALRIPVYCYDHFGGPGYIKPDIFDVAFENNFSGRGFQKKDSSQIVEELIGEYTMANNDLNCLYNFSKRKCSLKENMQEILSNLEAKPPVDIESIRKKYLNVQRNNSSLIRLFCENISLRNEVSSLSNEVSSLSGFRNTLSWKLGRIITFLPRVTKKWLHRVLN